MVLQARWTTSVALGEHCLHSKDFFWKLLKLKLAFLSWNTLITTLCTKSKHKWACVHLLLNQPTVIRRWTGINCDIETLSAWNWMNNILTQDQFSKDRLLHFPNHRLTTVIHLFVVLLSVHSHAPFSCGYSCNAKLTVSQSIWVYSCQKRLVSARGRLVCANCKFRDHMLVMIHWYLPWALQTHVSMSVSISVHL